MPFFLCVCVCPWHFEIELPNRFKSYLALCIVLAHVLDQDRRGSLGDFKSIYYSLHISVVHSVASNSFSSFLL
jgi:hypothetical protein